MTTDDGDEIPIVENYRGVGIHDQQDLERITIVKRAIDEVLAESDFISLANYLGRVCNPPEARLLAAAKIEAGFAIAADRRDQRPEIDLVKIRATVAGLSSAGWRDQFHYGSLLDVNQEPAAGGMVLRKMPLTET